MKIPETLEESFLILDEIDKIDKWLIFPESDATSMAHHTLGQDIRNNWGLWEYNGKLHDWFIDNGIEQPDDMSNIILTSYHRHKNNIDINLEEQFYNIKSFYLNDKKQKLKLKREFKLKKIKKHGKLL